jgi:hypothetical protein
MSFPFGVLKGAAVNRFSRIDPRTTPQRLSTFEEILIMTGSIQKIIFPRNLGMPVKGV